MDFSGHTFRPHDALENPRRKIHSAVKWLPVDRPKDCEGVFISTPIFLHMPMHYVLLLVNFGQFLVKVTVKR